MFLVCLQTAWLLLYPDCIYAPAEYISIYLSGLGLHPQRHDPFAMFAIPSTCTTTFALLCILIPHIRRDFIFERYSNLILYPNRTALLAGFAVCMCTVLDRCIRTAVSFDFRLFCFSVALLCIQLSGVVFSGPDI